MYTYLPVISENDQTLSYREEGDRDKDKKQNKIGLTGTFPVANISSMPRQPKEGALAIKFFFSVSNSS